jgi:hypothetical protein
LILNKSREFFWPSSWDERACGSRPRLVKKRKKNKNKFLTVEFFLSDLGCRSKLELLNPWLVLYFLENIFVLFFVLPCEDVK